MSRHSSARAGVTLIELLIAVTVLTLLVASTYMLFESQSESFRSNTSRFDLVQNARGSLEATERVVRTMGAGVTGNQPMLVYGANDVLSFNTDFVERDTVDMRWAAYWNPDAVQAETVVWEASAAAAIPLSSPSYVYPAETYLLGNGSRSPAETWTFTFDLDTGTPRSDDYVLRQQINSGSAEVVARNILPASNGAPFFQYLMERNLGTEDTLITASGALLPLIRRPLVAGLSAADSASYVRPDSVRAVRLNYRVTNGLTGTDERIREVQSLVETPNNGVSMPTICGRSPLPVGAFSATEVGTLQGRVALTWARSADQDAGEVDVRQYVLWRRKTIEPAFGPVLLVVRTESDTVTYTTEVTDNDPGESYIFGIAAQDCTPAFSTILTTTITLSGP
jgi:prepilin-type N-terminal cleavage/methylation domain-containing protein